MPDTGLDKGEDMKAETFLPDDYRPAEDEPFMNEPRHDRSIAGWHTRDP